MKLTSNFTLSEFTYSPTATNNGINNEPPNIAIENLRLLCIRILQPLRDFIGRAITISSGYRCIKLNGLVGGVITSQHVIGKAVDIKVEGMTPFEVASMILELNLPFDQLILYPTFVHVSYDDGHCRGQILYNKSYNGPKIN